MDLQVILQEAGIEVVGPAGSIEAALRLLESGPLDGAVLDANLGGQRVDDVATALFRRGVPFVLATGYGRESIPPALGKVPIVAKPFAARDLLQAVRGLLSGGRR